MTGPAFEQLVGADIGADERDRLRRVHDALLAAGPPAELPPRLERPPLPRAMPFPRRRVATFALAAALAVAAFGAGAITRDGGDGGAFATDFVLRMTGTSAAPEGLAVLAVGEIDEAGNWPMRMTVTGLDPGRYELLLTRDGRPAASCGTFAVDGRTVVFLNAPYRLRQFDGWVVTPEQSDRILLRTTEI